MMHDLNDYYVYQGKDGRYRATSPKLNKLVSYPRLLMENYLNRSLLPTEDVHHIDEDPTNNDISNLEIIDHCEHGRMHAQKYKDKEMICPICNKSFIWTAKQQSHANGNKNRKDRKTRNMSGPFCSKQCVGINNQRIQIERATNGKITGGYKYKDKIAVCVGCGKEFLYTAKMQRDRRKECRDTPCCSIECVYASNTKYPKDLIIEIQNKLRENNGNFAKTEREYNIKQGSLHNILRRRGLPHHKDDYKNIA